MELKLVRKVCCATVMVAISATSISCNRRDPNVPKVAAAIRKFNGRFDVTRWQRLFPETKPTRFLGIYSHCRDGGFQELFVFDVTGEEAKLLKFDTSIEDANRNR